MAVTRIARGVGHGDAEFGFSGSPVIPLVVLELLVSG